MIVLATVIALVGHMRISKLNSDIIRLHGFSSMLANRMIVDSEKIKNLSEDTESNEITIAENMGMLMQYLDVRVEEGAELIDDLCGTVAIKTEKLVKNKK